eukprot:6202898-Pleurochrysis_carterae.AAC.3
MAVYELTSPTCTSTARELSSGNVRSHSSTYAALVVIAGMIGMEHLSTVAYVISNDARAPLRLVNTRVMSHAHSTVLKASVVRYQARHAVFAELVSGQQGTTGTTSSELYSLGIRIRMPAAMPIMS